jgi:hypothetical protein
MSGDEFDLTRGGDEDADTAPVLSLRRRGRPNLPPGDQPQNGQNGAHRHLAARVQVPLTTPAEPTAETRTPTFGWNEPAHPAPQARPAPKRSARTPHRRAIALATLLLAALISAVTLIITTDQTSNGARAPRAHAATAPTDNSALLPGLTLTSQALTGDIDKLRSQDRRPVHAQHTAARKHHVTARHAPPSAATADRQSVSTPNPAPAHHPSTTPAAGKAADPTTNNTPAASSPTTARPTGDGSTPSSTGAGSTSAPPSSIGGGGSQSGSQGATTVKTGAPPCYPGTLGCQSP